MDLFMHACMRYWWNKGKGAGTNRVRNKRQRHRERKHTYAHAHINMHIKSTFRNIDIKMCRSEMCTVHRIWFIFCGWHLVRFTFHRILNGMAWHGMARQNIASNTKIQHDHEHYGSVCVFFELREGEERWRRLNRNRTAKWHCEQGIDKN